MLLPTSLSKESYYLRKDCREETDQEDTSRQKETGKKFFPPGVGRYKPPEGFPRLEGVLSNHGYVVTAG